MIHESLYVEETNGTGTYISTWLDSLPLALNLRETIEGIEKALICRALDASGGVQAEAARNLGISRSDMAYKLKKYSVST